MKNSIREAIREAIPLPDRVGCVRMLVLGLILLVALKLKLI